MRPHERTFVAAASAALVLMMATSGCTAQPVRTPAPQPPAEEPGQPQAPAGDSFFEEVNAAQYSDWATAPGYDSLQQAQGPHGEQVQIFLDPTAEQALAEGSGTWPEDSVIVKDIYRGGELVQIAAMKRTSDGWYWGEWDTQGTPVAEGLAVEPCEGCHADGSDGTLGVTLE